VKQLLTSVVRKSARYVLWEPGVGNCPWPPGGCERSRSLLRSSIDIVICPSQNLLVRRAAPKFLRQSFHEWAGRSITQSSWARAYYEQQRQRGKGHHAAVRALAFKWIRIAFRCWKNGVAYDERRYLATLVRRVSPLSVSMAAPAPAETL